MIKLFSLKQQKAEEANSEGGGKKIAPGLIRMQKGALRSPVLMHNPSLLPRCRSQPTPGLCLSCC